MAKWVLSRLACGRRGFDSHCGLTPIPSWELGVISVHQICAEFLCGFCPGHLWPIRLSGLQTTLAVPLPLCLVGAPSVADTIPA
jgi:hypothetical protein